MMKIWLRKIGVTCFRAFLLLVATVATIYAADYFLSLAKVDFIPFIEWPKSRLDKGARGNAIAAGAGIFAAYGALCTFAFTYWQKERHNRLSLDQARRQHEYDAIAREFSELSDDFAQNSQLARINAAINLARIGRMADPRREPLAPQQATLENLSLQYPWFRAAAMQMTAALLVYEDPTTLGEVEKAIGELGSFAKERIRRTPWLKQRFLIGNAKLYPQWLRFFFRRLEFVWNDIDPQPLLTFLIETLADANRSAYARFQERLTGLLPFNEWQRLDAADSAVRMIDDQEKNRKWVLEQLDSLKKTSFVSLPIGDKDGLSALDGLKKATGRVKLTQRIIGAESQKRSSEVWIRQLSRSDLVVKGRLGFEKACFAGGVLWGVNFSWADLTGADLRGVHLAGAYLMGAHLRWAYLRGAYLMGAHLEGAHLEGADLKEAYLIGVYLCGAHLEGADLRGAHLAGAYLMGAYLRGARLYGSTGLPFNARWGMADFRKGEWKDGEWEPTEEVDTERILELRKKCAYSVMDKDLLTSGHWPEGVPPFWEEGQVGKVEGGGNKAEDEGANS